MTSAWQPLTAAALRRLPPALRPWLADCGSLTAALRLRLAGALECALLGQGWRPPTADEAARLGLATRRAVFWRRVRFSYAGRALLIGHTLVPPATLARTPALRRLGDRPVGELLFSDPAARRRQVEVAGPRPGGAIAACLPAVAARRSVILLQRRPVMVVEHFLPPMLRLDPPPCP